MRDLAPLKASFDLLDLSKLTDRQIRLLYDDVACIVADELNGPLSIMFTEAERILLGRIGGQAALTSYAESLEAGVGGC